MSIVAQHLVGDRNVLREEFQDQLPLRDAAVECAVLGVVQHVELADLVRAVVLRANHSIQACIERHNARLRSGLLITWQASRQRFVKRQPPP